jgi:hypothetical protein
MRSARCRSPRASRRARRAGASRPSASDRHRDIAKPDYGDPVPVALTRSRCSGPAASPASGDRRAKCRSRSRMRPA